MRLLRRQQRELSAALSRWICWTATDILAESFSAAQRRSSTSAAVQIISSACTRKCITVVPRIAWPEATACATRNSGSPLSLTRARVNTSELLLTLRSASTLGLLTARCLHSTVTLSAGADNNSSKNNSSNNSSSNNNGNNSNNNPKNKNIGDNTTNNNYNSTNTMSADAVVAEEAACLHEIYGADFTAVSPRVWRVSVMPECTIVIFLPDDYPAT